MTIQATTHRTAIPAHRGTTARPHPDWFGDLTPREREVLLLVAKGLSNCEITEQLYVSMATVKTHIAQLLRKTGSRDRVHLVVRCWATGLVTRRHH